jgi:hypothetical protein
MLEASKMAKGKAKSPRLVLLERAKGGKPATLRNEQTGEMLVLQGYGASKGEYVVRKGIDLTKPIYEQVLRLEARNKRKASSKGRARKNA